MKFRVERSFPPTTRKDVFDYNVSVSGNSLSNLEADFWVLTTKL